MKEEFKWGKFILDCFICFWLMVISAIIFSYPFYRLYAKLQFCEIAFMPHHNKLDLAHTD